MKKNKKKNKSIVINLNFFSLKPVKENTDTMVLSTRRPRDRVKTSGIAKKKAKNNYKGHKKDNYKKVKGNVTQYVECSICFNKVSNTSDNSVKCGKKTHFICSECKFRCNETGNDKCPMCRSHPIKNPVARDVTLDIYNQGERVKHQKASPYIEINMTPKKRRQYNRSGGPYNTPFHSNTNRLRRERTICPDRQSSEGYNPNYTNNDITINWISNRRALDHYNGFVIPEDIDLEEIEFIID